MKPRKLSLNLKHVYVSNLLKTYIQKVVRKGDHSLKMSISFLEEHLCHWVPLFTKRIMENTDNAIYLELSKLLDAFINKEIELLRIVKQQLEMNSD